MRSSPFCGRASKRRNACSASSHRRSPIQPRVPRTARSRRRSAPTGRKSLRPSEPSSRGFCHKERKMNQKASPLLIVGSMAFDDLELPTISAKNVVGGSATYSAYAASVFAPVRLVAVVGEDFSSKDLEALSRRGVDL